MKEIGHLEERKEEAVKAAANCSAEHFQSMQDEFFSEFPQKYGIRKQYYFVVQPKLENPLLKPSKNCILVSGHRQ